MKRGLFFLLILLQPQWARPDALVVTKAMTATTVAEIYITENKLRVELEIGARDLAAFKNIMPDELYQRMGFEPELLKERSKRFFHEDLIISGDEPLEGRIISLTPRKRIKRDEITGEPLPVQGEEAEIVVYAELEYPWKERPSKLAFRPPMNRDSGYTAANIGFMVYHLGLAVNDFRYLGIEETLDLDWEDPWYSTFRNRNLRRQYYSPLMAFLYVDTFEVRKEIIARPKDLQQWVDLGIEGKKTIPVGMQEELKQRVADFLMKKNPVLIDGKTVPCQLDRIHFVKRTLRTTGVIDPPEELDVASATLGVIYVYPVQGLPGEVTMQWELFGPRLEKLPTSATDEAGGLPYTLAPDDDTLRWQNFLKNLSLPLFIELAPPPSHPALTIPLISAFAACGVLIALYGMIRGSRRKGALIAFPLAAVAILAFPYARISFALPGRAAVSQEESMEIVSGLLKNIYRAFDFRDESVIYDRLARSASGALLTRVYLETRKALELANQGGARVKVKEVEMLSTEMTPLDDQVGFTAQCTWIVGGDVGHWGHIHRRRNQYLATLTVAADSEAWKITDLTLLDEKRL